MSFSEPLIGLRTFLLERARHESLEALGITMHSSDWEHYVLKFGNETSIGFFLRFAPRQETTHTVLGYLHYNGTDTIITTNVSLDVDDLTDAEAKQLQTTFIHTVLEHLVMLSTKTPQHAKAWLTHPSRTIRETAVRMAAQLTPLLSDSPRQ